MISEEKYSKLINQKTAEEKRKEIKQRKENIKNEVKKYKFEYNLDRDTELLILIFFYTNALNEMKKYNENDYNVFRSAIRQAKDEYFQVRNNSITDGEKLNKINKYIIFINHMSKYSIDEIIHMLMI